MKVPDDLRGYLTLARGERLLAASELVGGGAAAATTHRLVVAVPPGSTADRWSDVVSASLEADDGVLDVELVDGGRRTLLLGPGHGRALTTAVRERIQHTVLLTKVVELRGRRSVRVVARRGDDGAPFIQVVPGPGVDVTGAEVARAVAEAERVVRDMVGLPPA